MNILDDILMIALRTLFSAVALFLISRFCGARQIAQLTFYDYCIGISIGSIAAVAVEKDVPLISIFVAMAVLGIFTFVLEFVTDKSIVCRRFISGTPVVMMHNGNFCLKNMKRQNYDINDILTQLRKQGYFDISQIKYAVLETDGTLSVLPYENYLPVCCNDMNISAPSSVLQYNVIIDGKVMKNNLAACGRNEQWLKNELKKQNAKIKDILLCTYDESGTLTVKPKDKGECGKNIFI
ncbi:MAG: DUF421 domain-containing protein [Acutalibacteraceae bacterium]|nr:DUF421 domain-containing protein [Acutalibacteraceae bacterium]